MSEDRSDPGTAAARWWFQALSPDTGAGRLARAKLRSAESPSEVLAVEAAHTLHAGLRAAGHDLRQTPDRLALVAVALANLKQDDGAEAAARFGTLAGDRPLLAPLRFQGLIRTHEPRALIRPLRRALPQIDHRASVARLARDLLFWGEEVRNRWCFAYYGAAAPTPERELGNELSQESDS